MQIKLLQSKTRRKKGGYLFHSLLEASKITSNNKKVTKIKDAGSCIILSLNMRQVYLSLQLKSTI